MLLYKKECIIIYKDICCSPRLVALRLDWLLFTSICCCSSRLIAVRLDWLLWSPGLLSCRLRYWWLSWRTDEEKAFSIQMGKKNQRWNLTRAENHSTSCPQIKSLYTPWLLLRHATPRHSSTTGRRGPIKGVKPRHLTPPPPKPEHKSCSCPDKNPVYTPRLLLRQAATPLVNDRAEGTN